jgi:hypothetical protein
MHFRTRINGKTFRVQFRLAVLCQLFTEEGKDGLVLQHQTMAICNPMDRFEAFEGVKIAYGRALDAILKGLRRPKTSVKSLEIERKTIRWRLWNELLTFLRSGPRTLSSAVRRPRQAKTQIPAALLFLAAANNGSNGGNNDDLRMTPR